MQTDTKQPFKKFHEILKEHGLLGKKDEASLRQKEVLRKAYQQSYQKNYHQSYQRKSRRKRGLELLFKEGQKEQFLEWAKQYEVFSNANGVHNLSGFILEAATAYCTQKRLAHSPTRLNKIEKEIKKIGHIVNQVVTRLNKIRIPSGTLRPSTLSRLEYEVSEIKSNVGAMEKQFVGLAETDNLLAFVRQELKTNPSFFNELQEVVEAHQKEVS